MPIVGLTSRHNECVLTAFPPPTSCSSDMPAYRGARFAIRGVTDALRSELEHDESRVRLSRVRSPAANTPQFDWARNQMPKRVQPVPPIHPPEAIAREIVRTAHDARKLCALMGMAATPAALGGLRPGRTYRT